MARLPGTIDLGKFRLIYEERPEHSSIQRDSYFLQQRAIIRLNEDLVKLAEPQDYAVYCDDENFKKQAGKPPSPLQYFIASIGFCMFSQLKRLAAKTEVILDDLEMDLCMSYDLSGRFSIGSMADAAQGIRYSFKIKSDSPIEKIIHLMQAADRGCHTVNSMRKRIPVSGGFVLNEREYEIGD